MFLFYCFLAEMADGDVDVPLFLKTNEKLITLFVRIFLISFLYTFKFLLFLLFLSLLFNYLFLLISDDAG